MNRKLITILAIVIALILGIVIFIILSRSDNTGSNQLPPAKTIEVPFDYTVKSIGTADMVLTGDEGDLSLSNDLVTVYKGDRGSKDKGAVSDLKVGSRVNVDLVPGRSATLYILE